jgi:hypothetical protein
MRDFLLSQHKNLEGVYEYLVSTIDNTVGRKTTRANPLLECDIRCCYTGEVLRKSPSEEGVLKISHGNWSRVFGRNRIDYLAIYLPFDGKIYLQEDMWCLCNFVHETLHSRSVLSKKNGPYPNLRFVYEGITELFTGWILQSEFKECFGSWSTIETCFLKPYLRWVKLWNYFSWKVGIKRIIDVYFDCSLTDPLEALVKLAIKKQYNIKNVFSPYDPNTDLESRFTNELSEVFGRDFDEYLASDIRLLEPGEI